MFPLGAIGFVYVRTRELFRIILWFGSFLMCFPTFILKARKLSILVTVERTAVNATKGPRLNIFMFCSLNDWIGCFEYGVSVKRCIVTNARRDIT